LTSRFPTTAASCAFFTGTKETGIKNRRNKDISCGGVKTLTEVPKKKDKSQFKFKQVTSDM
jgi:hypothetical protein